MKDFLPIGSVVLLKNADKKLMICGRIQTQSGDPKIYDYSGCLYPEGMISPKQMYLFNNEDILRVYYIGMQDEEEFKFRKYMISKVEEAQAAAKSREEGEIDGKI